LHPSLNVILSGWIPRLIFRSLFSNMTKENVLQTIWEAPSR
jgi:hypothetical protein